MAIPQHRDLAHGSVAPDNWFDAVERLLSSLPINVPVLLDPGDTTVRVPATNGRIGVVIDGKYRLVEADLTRAHPAQAAGTTYLYAVAAANSFAPGVPEVDNTFYGFELRITSGAAPTGTLAGGQAIIHTQRIKELVWDGSKITAVRPLSPDAAYALNRDARLAGSVPVGGLLAYAGDGDPTPEPGGGEFKLADGRLIDGNVYTAFRDEVGHAYNGGVDPGGGLVRLPDKRGRVMLGADNMGTPQGAANRITVALRARGQNGGSERVTLTASESGVKAHGHADSIGVSDTISVGDTINFRPQFRHASTVGIGPGGFMGNANAAIGEPADLNPGKSGSAYRAGGVSKTGSVTSHAGESAGSSHQNLQPFEVDNVIVRVA